MKDNRKEFVFVIGKSAGMDQNAMLEGFNSLIEAQKKIKDESTYTLVFFNEECKASALCKSIKGMRKYTEKTYVPKGGSGLYDAMGYAINAVGEKLSETDEYERPSLVCVIVIGESDNASTVFEQRVVADMINLQKHIYKWDFVMYSDASHSFDINKGGSMKDTKRMFREINDYMTALR